MATQRPLETCKCCGTTDQTVKVRNPMVDRTGRTGPPLCDPCWADPHNRMVDCQHGRAQG